MAARLNPLIPAIGSTAEQSDTGSFNFFFFLSLAARHHELTSLPVSNFFLFTNSGSFVFSGG